jgi:hypothetical protein
MAGSVYYISAQGVLEIPDPHKGVSIKEVQSMEDVVALVDADGEGAPIWPRYVLMCSRSIRIIMASSLREPSDRKWLKQLNVPEHRRVRLMDIWSEEELTITG